MKEGVKEGEVEGWREGGMEAGKWEEREVWREEEGIGVRELEGRMERGKGGEREGGREEEGMSKGGRWKEGGQRGWE